MWRLRWLTALLAVGMLAACGGGSSSPGDTGDDVDADAGDVVDGDEDTTDADDVLPDGVEDVDETVDGEDAVDGEDVTPDAKRTVIAPTSGGGQVQSANYQMRLYVGTPQPMGSSEGSAYRAGFGPGAQANQ